MSDHESDCSKGILILNDNCLLEIFQHLSLNDLTNFKEAYESLGAAADIDFQRKTKGALRLVYNWNIRDDLQIIRQFGSSVKDLYIAYDRLRETKWSEIFSTINEHCNEKLKSLALSGDAVAFITKADVLLIVDILKNIEAINLDIRHNSNNYNVDYPNELINILSHCENARALGFISNIAIDVHETMFLKNKDLLRLQLLGKLNDRNLKSIVDNLVNTQLKDLRLAIWSVNVFDGNLSQLFRLTHLQRLSITCLCVDISHLLLNLDALNSLNVLILLEVRLEERHIAAMGKMTRLKVLKLEHAYNLNFESVLVLCGNKNFEHLILFCDFDDFNSIDESQYLKIIEKRKQSTANNCLHLTLSNQVYTTSLSTIPSALLEANKETIKLIDRWDRKYRYHNLCKLL